MANSPRGGRIQE